MHKVRNIFKTIKSAFIIIFFRVYNKHFETIHDFENAGEDVGTQLSTAVSEAVEFTGQCFPDEYKERLRDAVRRGFNR